MDWINCNCCNTQPSENKKFFLSNCGHLFCEDCASQDKDPCKICGQICMLLLLSSPLKPDIAIYFTDPSDQLQKYFKELTRIMEFQKGHGHKLLAGYKRQIATLNEKLQEALQRERTLQNENENQRQEIKYLTESLNNSPFRGGQQNVAQCPPTGSSCYSAMSICSSGNTTLVHTPTGSSLQGQGGTASSASRRSIVSTPITSKRLSIHTPPGSGRLTGNTSGSAFNKRSQESQTLKMLTQSLLYSSGKRCTPGGQNAIANTVQNSQNPPTGRLQMMSRTPSQLSNVRGMQQQRSEYISPNIPERPTPSGLSSGMQIEKSSIMNRPISLKVDYQSIRSDLKSYLTSKSNLPTPSWRH